MESYASRVREQLSSLEIKKKCCKKAFDSAVQYDGASGFDAIIAQAKCPSCASHIVAGLFVSHGSVTDPMKQYHLDLKLSSETEAELIASYLSENGMTPKTRKREEHYIVYFKDSSAIEDFLAFIGANGAAFDVMNSKIVKEVRNDANRAVNCDTANIRKSLEASAHQTEIINEMIDCGLIDTLPNQLKETALLRVKYDQLTIADLGMKHEKPITKSGVKHRLEKIVEYYEAEKAKK